MKIIPSIIMVVAIGIALLLATGCVDEGPAGWNLTLAYNETTEHLSMKDLKAMPSFSGDGYLISTVGIRYGPFTGKGLPLSDITERMGGLGENGRLYLYGSDGYLWVLDAKQIAGEGYITFDENLGELQDQKVVPVLMYEQDGKSLTEEEGGPLRLALLTNEPGIITEGSAWVKWVTRIELHK